MTENWSEEDDVAWTNMVEFADDMIESWATIFGNPR